MNVSEILELGIVGDDTVVLIETENGRISRGNWFSDHILRYSRHLVKKMTWTPELVTIQVEV